MKKNKKLDVHMVQHTHWDREWYFTSDDSRTMLYYDLKYLIEYLEKNDDKFTFDGQSSIIDDFLKFSPEWKPRFKKVIKDKKLLVGPFYTQTDNVLPNGESIIRNIEVGSKIANSMGHNMKVGYLPDTFGHNNQSPQILKMNGINNISFYRGLDPIDTNDQLYFNYKGQDGTEILGHWQTHYSTSGGAFGYTTKAFEEHIVADYKKPGLFAPSVKSYAKRNQDMPIAIPVGTDQMPFRKEVKEILKELNKKYENYNFIVSDYEEALKKVVQEIKEKKLELPVVTSELRQALTGRVHRTVLSSRMDIKQLHFELESILINTLEPLTILCHLNNVDVPWNMVEHVWKELFKSSAHDSYGTTNEDVVNEKLKHRLKNAIRISQGIVAILTRIFSSTIIDEKEDKYKKLVLFNLQHKEYSGMYQFTTTVLNGHEDGKFKIYDGKKQLKYQILKRNNVGTHERDALTLLINVDKVNAFSYKVFDIKYTNNLYYKSDKSCEIKANGIKINITKNNIIITKGNKEYKNILKFAADPSVGDTYDHSPLTWNDKKFILNNYKILETSVANNTIRFKAFTNVPSGIKSWKQNKISLVQDIDVQLTIIGKKIHLKCFVKNKMLDGRLILLVNSLSNSSQWKHDQQFGTYVRDIENKYMKNWKKPNELGYKWCEYPTNLSPHQSFIYNFEENFTIFTKGTREHEMIRYENQNQFAITLYRAFGVFGRGKFIYRPGRASGAQTAAPDCQMLNDVLEYDFVLDLNKSSDFERFEFAKQLENKTFYIPGQWGLDRTILRWNTNIDYYSKQKNRNAKLYIPSDIDKNNFVMTSLYKDPKNRIIARYLNIGDATSVNSKLLISRDLIKFNKNKLSVPKFGLVNILIKEVE